MSVCGVVGVFVCECVGVVGEYDGERGGGGDDDG